MLPVTFDRRRMGRLAAYAATWVIWGSTYLAIRVGVEALPPFLLAGVRSVAAGCILCAWGVLRGDRLPTRRQWGAAALTGALFFLLGHGGLFWGEQRVPSGPAALLVATEHLWIVMFAWMLPGGVRPTRRALAGIGVGLAGVGLLTVDGGIGRLDPAGAGAVLLCALTWAAGLVYFRGGRRPQSDAFAAGAPLLAGGVQLLAASLGLGEPQTVSMADVTPQALGALAYLIVFGSVVAFTALTWLNRVEGPGRSASYAYVNPLVAVALGWAFAGEAVSARVLLAGAAIVAAVLLVVTGTRAEPGEAPAAPVRSARPRGPRLPVRPRLRTGET